MADEIKYGLSPSGFKRKRLPDIIKAINSRLEDALGTSIQTSSNSVFGQLVGVFSYEIADLWEQTEKAYNAMYPSTAQGVSLSNAAGLAGIQLIEAESTTIVATCFGSEGMEIPYNAQITDGTYTFSCLDVYEQILSSRACVIGVKLSTAVSAGTAYKLTIDNQTQTYTAVSGDTEASVLANLAALFIFDDRSFAVRDGVLMVTMADQSKTMHVVAGTNVYISLIGSPFNFRCDTAGAITPALGTVTQIVTSYAGWDTVENQVPAATGRDAETDNSLRQRWAASVYSRASAMVEAIRASLYNVDGVAYAIVYENDTDYTDVDSRPPHSIEAVVDGGAAADVAKAIWKAKAAGITTYGSTSVDVADSQGITHTIKFNRPDEVTVYLTVEVTANPERELSSAAPDLIISAILAQGAAMSVGQDVILQNFYGTVMQASSFAVGYMTITASTDGETYSTDNISISARQVATFAASRITVTVNT